MRTESARYCIEGYSSPSGYAQVWYSTVQDTVVDAEDVCESSEEQLSAIVQDRTRRFEKVCADWTRQHSLCVGVR